MGAWATIFWATVVIGMTNDSSLPRQESKNLYRVCVCVGVSQHIVKLKVGAPFSELLQKKMMKAHGKALPFQGPQAGAIEEYPIRPFCVPFKGSDK